MKRISVCMAAHVKDSMQECYITQQINSILKQLGDNDELIISDDSDSTYVYNYILGLNDERIRLLKFQPSAWRARQHEAFYHASENFYNAMRVAEGRYIFFSDQDDIWHNKKVEICLQYLEKYDFISHNFGIINDEGDIVTDKFLMDYEKLNPLRKRMLLIRTPYRGCCLAMKREVMESAFPFPDNTFMHDIWIGCVATLDIKGYKFKFVDDSLIMYRRHKGNVSDFQSSNSILFKIYSRMLLYAKVFGFLIRKKKKH